MCLDCGCMMPDERHGSEDHIIMEDIVKASEASEQPLEKTLNNIDNTMRQVLGGKLKSKSWSPE